MDLRTEGSDGMAFSFRHLSITRGVGLSPPDLSKKIELYDPGGLLDRINRTFRRRLSDKVEDVFQAACLAGDLDAAEDLLTTLERMHERRVLELGGERRISDDALVRARKELARRRAARLPRAA